MTNKAYIVTNETQEREVLEKLERQGIKWVSGGKKPTEFTPKPIQFPYGLFTDDEGHLQWGNMRSLEDEEIVFDGRTEPEHVKVSKEVMKGIKEYVDAHKMFYWLYDFTVYPESVQTWLQEDRAERVKLLIDYIEGNRTLITTEQYVIRSIDPDENGDYSYLRLGVQSTSVPDIEVAQIKLEEATHFETREEASKFLISGMEIVEV